MATAIRAISGAVTTKPTADPTTSNIRLSKSCQPLRPGAVSAISGWACCHMRFGCRPAISMARGTDNSWHSAASAASTTSRNRTSYRYPHTTTASAPLRPGIVPRHHEPDEQRDRVLPTVQDAGRNRRVHVGRDPLPQQGIHAHRAYDQAHHCERSEISDDEDGEPADGP